MRALITTCFVATAFATAQAQDTFTGDVTDSTCARADHSDMRMGSTDAECTVACIFAHGSLYVLYDGRETFGLSDQQASREFAGKTVTVTGTLDEENRTIQMVSIVLVE